MSLGGGKATFWRSVSLTLVIFALAMKVLAPPGFMVAGNVGAVPLVICTGHGPLVLGGHGEQKAPVHKASDAPCAFAGSSTPPTPSVAASIAEPIAIVTDPIVGLQGARRAPGRGLAAPPPPPRGPPLSV
jgi:hypothetical protein